MKRAFYTLILLLNSPAIWADSVTTGDIGLLKPSTGVVDTSRSWADKLNSNFDMIAATITTTRTSISNLNTSTGTYASAVALDTTSLITAVNSTHTAFRNYSSTADTAIGNRLIDGFGVVRGSHIYSPVQLEIRHGGSSLQSGLIIHNTIGAGQRYAQIAFLDNGTTNFVLMKDFGNNFFAIRSSASGGGDIVIDANTGLVRFSSSALVNIASITVVGAVTSTTGFVGDGSKLYALSTSPILADITTFVNSTFTAFAAFSSTSDVQQTKFVNFRSTSDTKDVNFHAFQSTSDAQQTKFVNFRSTSDTKDDNFHAFQSTSDAQQTKFVNFRSTSDTKDVNFHTFQSTSDAQQTAFVNFRTTSDAKDVGFHTFQSTSDAQQTKFVNFRSTSDSRIDTAGVVFTSNTSLQSTTNTWSAAQSFSSITVTGSLTINSSLIVHSSLTVAGSSITFRTYTMVFASAPTAGQHLFAARVSDTDKVLIAGGGDQGGGIASVSGNDMLSQTQLSTITIANSTVTVGVFRNSSYLLDNAPKSSGTLAYAGDAGSLWVSTGTAIKQWQKVSGSELYIATGVKAVFNFKEGWGGFIYEQFSNTIPCRIHGWPATAMWFSTGVKDNPTVFLNGSTAFIEVPDDQFPNLFSGHAGASNVGQMVWAIWVKPNVLAGVNRAFIWKGSASNYEYELYYIDGNSQVRLDLNSGAGSGVFTVRSSVPVNTDQWNLVVGRINKPGGSAGDRSSVCINGICNGQTSVTDSAAATADGIASLHFGARHDGQGTELFTGSLGPAMYWERYVTDQEIMNMWNSGRMPR